MIKGRWRGVRVLGLLGGAEELLLLVVVLVAVSALDRQQSPSSYAMPLPPARTAQTNQNKQQLTSAPARPPRLRRRGSSRRPAPSRGGR